MPWSPIPKFPDIIRDLKKSGYIKEVNFEILRVAIMRQTGLMRDQTIKQTIQAMQDLGFVKLSGSGVTWYICDGKPYNFDSSIEKNEKKEVDKLLDKKLRG